MPPHLPTFVAESGDQLRETEAALLECARGLNEVRDAGAQTVAQNEASCVVFGMPKEALKLEAAERVLALDDLPEAILAANM